MTHLTETQLREILILIGCWDKTKNIGLPFKKTIDDVITRKQMTAWNFVLH
jgi:hypothetical protein